VAESYSRAEAATRAGIDPAALDRLVELGIVRHDEDAGFTRSHVLRAQMAQALATGGIPLEGVASAIRNGELSLDFLDTEAYERFAAFGEITFRELSENSGTPIELLMVIREATGGALPSPDDRVREDELAVATFVQAQLRFGFRPIAIERLLRVTGESLRRIAEQEGDWWRTEVLEPRLAVGGSASVLEAAQGEISNTLSALAETSLMAIYHAQQSRAWTTNIIAGFEVALARAGLHSRLERPPAMCFLDISGYTRLTQERGDEAAAGLATDLSRLVQRTSMHHGGKPVKWLGDGVMLFFKEPGSGVEAALDMVEGVASAGLPPAHVGLHAGPILYQAGDYFGSTVNAASRIADYARPGEVLVSQEVVEAAAGTAASFTEIGPVELKGLGAALRLHVAHRR
jgi:adenylate cyclase